LFAICVVRHSFCAQLEESLPFTFVRPIEIETHGKSGWSKLTGQGV
jgi:hypothetical protein